MIVTHVEAQTGMGDKYKFMNSQLLLVSRHSTSARAPQKCDEAAGKTLDGRETTVNTEL